ncbi:MBL fold metallo-hydrolase [Pseudobutyrivibrio sp. MD2005]|uniref:MBL fold metallo-hydrolase n=1 Tax=Pseudobutyrivibrio sp. MD2005 TaxID=1410616 RepID=UPI0004899DD4|nr:MBL fold metallo-hydrolase [Pseudobutyrivibrio sp. MD2005]
METKGTVKVRLHRGAKQIGGVCTEIFTDDTRLLFDIGAPLEGEGDQARLDIDGVTTGTTNCDGIFLTHYHGDHIGEVDFVDVAIPVYMEKHARKILELQQDYKKGVVGAVWADNVNEIEICKPIRIKEFTITALESDHSATNSVMFLIEAYGKRILITGDYRLHGFYKDKVEVSLMNLGHIDLMITEGTNISKETSLNVPYLTEQALVPAFVEAFKKYKYVFLLASSSQLDRIASFSRCVPNGKYMITDRYQYDLMKIYDEEREETLKSRKVLYSSDYVLKKAEKAGFGMAIRSNYYFPLIVKDYFERHPKDTCMIYSMWSGYINKYSNIKQLVDYSGDNLIKAHVSGHVTKEDLERVIGMIKPENIIVHHTESSNSTEEKLLLPQGVKLISVTDGEFIVL